MNDKKNIDRLFQEKFKDFEVVPDEIIWEKIKARQKKDKRRLLLLPFWYKVAGVAALIALIFGISNTSFNNNEQQDNILTDSDTQKVIEENSDENFKTSSDEIIVTSEKEKESNTSDKKLKNTKPDQDNEKGKHNYVDPFIIKEDAVVKTSENTPSQTKEEDRFASSPTNPINKNTVPPIVNNNLTNQTSAPQKDDIAITQEKTKGTTTTISDSKNKSSEPEKNQSIFAIPNDKNNKNTSIVAENNTNKSDTETEVSTPEENSGNLNKDGKKSIFDVVNKEKEEEEIAEKALRKKWDISPNVAPVYYNAIGSGSSIDSQFSDNNKNGQINMSYGLKVSYAINERFSVRSGVNKVDLSYNTEGIGFAPSSVGQNLENIDYNTTASAIIISDIQSPTNSSVSNSDVEITRNAVDRTQNQGLLNHSIGYIEVPLEMEYALIDKKFGINMIGGISTLFLQDNEVSIEAGDFETPIGATNNLNEVSFSGNIGLGVDYKISDKLEVNLEPIFKYQFNALNESTDSFRPYYFGVYTGISIKF